VGRNEGTNTLLLIAHHVQFCNLLFPYTFIGSHVPKQFVTGGVPFLPLPLTTKGLLHQSVSARPLPLLHSLEVT
jgi:hypothetical protein